eukprot:TRINITY_DN1906_c0_g2_i1.p1 TRINITY_DN1906_c0_g2~~TRINITY_DN1906_c0_g2_i1.p1  ORF type:complete len:774 (+),score=321.41 TRINITY_DN1906_c0_g2_i1:51-2372(+)
MAAESDAGMRNMGIVGVCAVLIAGMGAAAWLGASKFQDGCNNRIIPFIGPLTTEQWLGLQASFYAPFIAFVATLIAARLLFVTKVFGAGRVAMAVVAIAIAVLYTVACVLLIHYSLGNWKWVGGGTSCNGMAMTYVIIGAPACIVVVLSMMFCVWRIIVRKTESGEEANGLLKGKKVEPTPTWLSTRRTHWLSVLFCVAYIPCLVLITAFFPNSWANFAEWASGRDPHVTNDGPSTGVYNVHLFDVDSEVVADGQTTNRFYLKFYSTVMMYYGMLYLATLVGLASALSPTVYAFLHRRFTIGARSFTYGTAFLTTLLTVVVVYFFCFWIKHEYETQSAGLGFPEPEVKHLGSIWARTFGQMAALFMGFLVLPLPRNFGFWSTGLGVSWEASITFHRWAGYAVFFFSALHQIMWWVEWGQDHEDMGYKASWREFFTLDRAYHFDDYTITCITAAWWTAVVLVLALSIETVRRNYFEVFYYAHHFGMVFLFVCMLHGHSLWYYTFGGLSLWLVDRLLRFNKSALPVAVVDAVPFTGKDGREMVTRLVVEVPESFTYTAGQFAFLNIPEISALEWHPFTLSSSPADGNRVTFHIKSMGAAQWTGKLNELVRTQGKGALTVCLDGAYGTPPDFDKYDHVVFVAGGIGITPARSIMTTLAEDKKDYAATLLWVVESYVDRSYMDGALETLRRSEGNVGYKVIVRGEDMKQPQTLPESIVPVVDRAEVVPRICDQIDAIRVTDPTRLLVHVCGPPGLRDAVKAEVLKRSHGYHTETFAL